MNQIVPVTAAIGVLEVEIAQTRQALEAANREVTRLHKRIAEIDAGITTLRSTTNQVAAGRDDPQPTPPSYIGIWQG